MKKFFILNSILLFVLLLSSATLAQKVGEDAILGKWLNQDKTGKFEIYKENGKFYGKIYWLKRPVDRKTGKPKTDTYNPDKKLQGRKLMGLVFLTDFVFDGDSYWENGKIYDPNSGSTYKSNMHLESNDVLKVKGYIGFAFLGRTVTWTRVKE